MTLISPSLSPAWRNRRSFHETWYLKLNDPAGQKALWLRFDLLVSRNGFRKVGEVYAVFFQRKANGEIAKTALKQSFGIDTAQNLEEDGASIGPCEIRSGRTLGHIQSKGQAMSWDLKFVPRKDLSFSFFPPVLKRLGLVAKGATTQAEDLIFKGSMQINGETIRFENSVGMKAHFSGRENYQSWVWGHCNSFVDSNGAETSFVFEGLCVRTRMFHSWISPPICSFFFYYEGQTYSFNSLWHAFHSRSKNNIRQWDFRIDHGDLSFRGTASANHKDFAGLTFEDAQGGLLYSANSKLSSLKIYVYRKGKPEASFHSEGSAAFEVVSREKNPYVPLLI